MWNRERIPDTDGTTNATLLSLLRLYRDRRKGWVLHTALRLPVQYYSRTEGRRLVLVSGKMGVGIQRSGRWNLMGCVAARLCIVNVSLKGLRHGVFVVER